MSEEPKPCPFCKSENLSIISENLSIITGPKDYVECRNCGARGPIAMCEKAIASKALELWNTRVGEE